VRPEHRWVDFDTIRGSGNVFRDFDHPDTEREQLRALVASRIIGMLDDQKFTVRAAHKLTGITAADFAMQNLSGTGTGV
jgi:hypothetical protein